MSKGILDAIANTVPCWNCGRRTRTDIECPKCYGVLCEFCGAHI